MMLSNMYSNFVRPSSSVELKNSVSPSLSGEDARRIYLDEIKEAGNLTYLKKHVKSENNRKSVKDLKLQNISKKDLFMSAQNNDVQTMKQILDTCPNMLNTTDNYGWSLLMIACQANSVDAVKELLIRGINTFVRDKAGNSAQSLVIKNRNLILADIILGYKSSEPVAVPKTNEDTKQKPISTLREYYFCEICNTDFPDKEEHLSSTVHNIDASKGKKIPSSYKIPATNKGYQIMLKVGWDRDTGLGPDGSGKRYPIKTIQKKDRKGLGLDKRKKKPQKERKETIEDVNRKMLKMKSKNSKSMEINFRRQFY